MGPIDAEPFPWKRVMAVGLGLLHLSPDQFWSMTIHEIEAAVGGVFGEQISATPLGRAELDELMQRFPD